MPAANGIGDKRRRPSQQRIPLAPLSQGTAARGTPVSPSKIAVPPEKGAMVRQLKYWHDRQTGPEGNLRRVQLHPRCHPSPLLRPSRKSEHAIILLWQPSLVPICKQAGGNAAVCESWPSEALALRPRHRRSAYPAWNPSRTLSMPTSLIAVSRPTCSLRSLASFPSVAFSRPRVANSRGYSSNPSTPDDMGPSISGNASLDRLFEHADDFVLLFVRQADP